MCIQRYGPTDFHCERVLNSWTDPLDLNAGWLTGLVDLNTEKDFVQERIAAYLTDLIGQNMVLLTRENTDSCAPPAMTGGSKHPHQCPLPLSRGCTLLLCCYDFCADVRNSDDS